MTSNKVLSVLVVVVAIFALATTIPPSSASVFTKTYTVHIINELSGKETLSVQCNCTDTSRPVGFVKPGTEYQWSFKNHFNRKTLWVCDLSPGNNRRATINAYQDMIPDYDRNVYWAVKEDGIYFRYPGSADAKQYTWGH
ncbi:S-protein homolog 8 [Linum grandiflorum]